MIFDTKLGVDIDAAEFLARLWPLWNPLEWLGTLQDQYIGYAIPMAPFFLIGQVLHAADLGDRAAVAVAADRGRLLGHDQARHRAADRLERLPAAGRRRCSRSGPRSRSSSARRPPRRCPGCWCRGRSCRWSPCSRVGGRLLVGCARSGVAVMLMGGVNAVVHDLRPGAARRCTSSPTAAGGGGSGLGLLLGRGGGRGHRVVGRPAAAPGPVLVQLPALRRAVGHHDQDHVDRPRSCAATGNWTAYFDLGTPWLSAGWTMVANPARHRRGRGRRGRRALRPGPAGHARAALAAPVGRPSPRWWRWPATPARSAGPLHAPVDSPAQRDARPVPQRLASSSR